MAERVQMTPDAIASTWRGDYRVAEPMARYNTWRAGGKAKSYFRPADLADLREFVATLDPQEPILWHGLGSNLLVRDGGFPGVVINLTGVLAEIRTESDRLIYAQAGVACNKLARTSTAQGYSGGEFLAGIPGTVGGALAMNAGAFGGETWTFVVAVELLERDGSVRRAEANEFEVGYRHVAGQGESAFVGAWFKFDPADTTKSDAIKALLKRRNDSQPIGQPSCGSVFRNPPGDHAARLIEAAGLKGERIGDAEVSRKHANFIINVGSATATDIESLIEKVRATVRQQFGVELITEARIVGVPEEPES